MFIFSIRIEVMVVVDFFLIFFIVGTLDPIPYNNYQHLQYYMFINASANYLISLHYVFFFAVVRKSSNFS